MPGGFFNCGGNEKEGKPQIVIATVLRISLN